MPTDRPSGRSLVTRRAILDIVHAAATSSYGVTGFAANPAQRLLGAVGLGRPGVRVGLRGGLSVDLDLTVAYGLPIAEVARQVESAVRYAVRHALDREIDRLAIHVNGLRLQRGSAPPQAAVERGGVGSSELAESGSDVA